MTDEFERELARSLRSAGRSVAPSPTGYLQIRNKIEVRAKRARRVARAAVGSLSVLVVTVIGVLIATGDSGSRPVEIASPEEPGLPGYSPEAVPLGMHIVSVQNSQSADEVVSPEFVQVYRSTETDSRVIVRQRPAAESLLTELATAPSEAEIFAQSNGSRALRWTTSSGHEYEVSGWAVSDEELLSVARSNSGDVGTVASPLPGDMALVAEGNFSEPDSSTNFRSFSLESEAGADHVSSIEVTIRTGDQVAFEVVRIYAEQSEWVGENKLLARPSEGELLVLWSPSPQLLIETRSIGVSEEELLDFVERLQPVGDEAWLDLAALVDIEEPKIVADLPVLAEASGLIDSQPWTFSWPAEPVSALAPAASEEDLEMDASPEAEAEPVSEVSDATTTTEVAVEAEPIGDETLIEPSKSPEFGIDASAEPHCLSLSISNAPLAQQCEIGLETQAWLFPVLERSLLVIYSPTGDLATSTSMVILSQQGIEILEADATAKGRVWLAWLDSGDILSITQTLSGEILREFPLVVVDVGAVEDETGIADSEFEVLR